MTKYEPSVEEIKYTINNARNILLQFFPRVTDLDVETFRNLMRDRLIRMNPEYAKIFHKDEDNE